MPKRTSGRWESATSPDVLITYRVSTERTIQINLARLSPGEASLMVDPGGLISRGTLVLEARDAREGRTSLETASGTATVAPARRRSFRWLEADR